MVHCHLFNLKQINRLSFIFFDFYVTDPFNQQLVHLALLHQQYDIALFLQINNYFDFASANPYLLQSLLMEQNIDYLANKQIVTIVKLNHKIERSFIK